MIAAFLSLQVMHIGGLALGCTSIVWLNRSAGPTALGLAAASAALKGVPAFIFASIFFNRFSRCQRITIDEVRTRHDISELIEVISAFYAADKDTALSAIFRYSFAGRLTGVACAPNLLDAVNVEQFMACFRILTLDK